MVTQSRPPAVGTEGVEARRTGGGRRYRWRSPQTIELTGVIGFLLVTSLTIFMIVPTGVTSPSGLFYSDWTMTEFGPLGPADREVLIKVRQAGLWEIPVGQQALDRAQSERVKEVGATLADDHLLMDEQVREIALLLDVPLPNSPTREQQRWMNELSGMSGEEFDRTFANRLRFAHGGVFEVLAEARAGTRNELVRSFSQHGMIMVMRHMTLLESTGYVEYEHLPEPRQPERRPD